MQPSEESSTRAANFKSALYNEGFFMSAFYVYILENPKGKFYIGHTEDLNNQVADHNRADTIDGKYIRKNGS